MLLNNIFNNKQKYTTFLTFSSFDTPLLSVNFQKHNQNLISFFLVIILIFKEALLFPVSWRCRLWLDGGRTSEVTLLPEVGLPDFQSSVYRVAFLTADTLTSSFTKYKFLHVKNDFSTIVNGLSVFKWFQLSEVRIIQLLYD